MNAFEVAAEKIFSGLKRYSPIKRPDWTAQNPLTGLVEAKAGNWIPISQAVEAVSVFLRDSSPRLYTAADIDSAPDGLYVMGTSKQWEDGLKPLNKVKPLLHYRSPYWRLAYGPYPASPESAYPLGE